jgi:hypothetical protein
LRRPAGDFGPVDLRELARLAAKRFSETCIRTKYAWGGGSGRWMLLRLLTKIDDNGKNGRQINTDAPQS